MKVKFFANMRDFTGEKNIDFQYCHTLRELLVRLSEHYGEKFRNKIFEGSEISKEVIVLVNGRHIDHLQGIDTKLQENDEISIFPVVAGG